MKKYKWIYEQALRLNTPKNKFVIWGTCLGFEAILYAASNYQIETTEVDTLNQAQKIKWVKSAYKNSEFDQVIRKSVAKEMEEVPLAYFSHHWGFTTKDFYAVPQLKRDFKIVAFYKKKGMEIVAAIQHKKYPIIATQFHPEKILYEHKKKVNVPLTTSAVMESQELSRILFVNALRNSNVFMDQKLLDQLEFKNFNTKLTKSVFESVYSFNKDYFKLKKLMRRENTTDKFY